MKDWYYSINLDDVEKLCLAHVWFETDVGGAFAVTTYLEKQFISLIHRGLICTISVRPARDPDDAQWVYRITDRGRGVLRRIPPEEIANKGLGAGLYGLAAYFVKRAGFEHLPQFLTHPNIFVRDAAQLRYFELRHSWGFWPKKLSRRFGRWREKRTILMRSYLRLLK